jgi:hypothetical protein
MRLRSNTARSRQVITHAGVHSRGRQNLDFLPTLPYSTCMKRSLSVRLPDVSNRPYPILIEPGALRRLPGLLKDRWKGRAVFVVSDTNVSRIYGRTLMHELLRTGLDAALVEVLPVKPQVGGNTMPSLPRFSRTPFEGEHRCRAGWRRYWTAWVCGSDCSSRRRVRPGSDQPAGPGGQQRRGKVGIDAPRQEPGSARFTIPRSYLLTRLCSSHFPGPNSGTAWRR